MADFYDPDNDDGRGYEPESSSSNKKKGWWWSDYDYDHRDYSYSKGSGSRSWMSKIGGYDSDDYWKPKKNPNEVYQDLLNQLQNSANIIGSDDRGQVVVHWSNGADVNDLKADKAGCHNIYLSPDNVLTNSGGKNEVSEEILDAMTGKVYLASTLRETVDQKSYDKAKIARAIATAHKNKIRANHPCPCGSGAIYADCCKKHTTSTPANVIANAVTLWESIETSIARSKIVEDWTGFGPYIAQDAERSSATKQQVQDFIDASVDKPSVDAATVAIAWNLLNSNDPVTIPDCYDQCIEAASEMMEEEISPEDRFDACEDLTDKIYKILKTKKTDGSSEGDPDSESESDDGDGSSDGDGDGDGSDGGGDDGEEAEGGDRKPSLCDSTLLGSTVGNKTDVHLSEQEAKDEIGKSEEEKSEIGAEVPDGLCDLGEKYDLVKVKANADYKSQYSSVVSEHKSAINAIRSSLLFRSNVAKLLSYGHRSGDIDENSLYKIGMNDDRVMTKTDTISSKKIAICLLVDESGSMGSGGRYIDARNVAITMAESLKGMDGIDVHIYGHSAEEGSRKMGVVLREYYSPRQKNLAACMEISARAQNHDSWAILHTANIFNRDCIDYDRKIMFVISDGEPAGSNYGGAPARKHMLAVSQACRKKGLEVYGIGVDNAFSEKYGKEMYGENHFVVLDNVTGSLGVMSRFIRQIAMK